MPVLKPARARHWTEDQVHPDVPPGEQECLRFRRGGVALSQSLGRDLMQQKADEVLNQGAFGAERRAALSDEIVAFIESGVSIVIGVVGPDGRARTGRALAARVGRDGTIRLIYTEEGNAAVTVAAQSGGPIAVTFSAPLSHRTLQIKGFSCRPEQLEPDDEAVSQRQTEAFAAILGVVGHSPTFVRAFSDYRCAPLSVLSFPAQEAFEQTPGPGAGRSL